jgi:putative flippase GtrA
MRKRAFDRVGSSAMLVRLCVVLVVCYAVIRRRPTKSLTSSPRSGLDGSSSDVRSPRAASASTSGTSRSAVQTTQRIWMNRRREEIALVGVQEAGERPPIVVAPSGRSPRLVRFFRFVRFSMVGASGIVVNEAALALFVGIFHVHYVVGALLATPCSTLWNFILLEIWVFKNTSHRHRRWHRWVMLMVVNNIANFATLPLLVLGTSVLGINYLISNLVTLILVVVARFALADRIWAPALDAEASGTEI